MAKKKDDPRLTSGSKARRDAADALRRLLAAIEAGELEADSPRAKALIRRLEGAVVGLEADDDEHVHD
jgi:transcription elongation GreA/GreB family factor